MTSLISVVIEGRCTTFICGCKKNHRWNLLFYPICLMMSSLIVEEVVFQPLLPGDLPQSLNPRSMWVLEADLHLLQVWEHWLKSVENRGSKL
jgi:hypothetical protein